MSNPNELRPSSRAVLNIFNRLGIGPAIEPTRTEWSTLWLISLSVLIVHYDQAIYGMALPRIQESLGIGDEIVGSMTALLAIGVIPAFAVAFLGDTLGRCRLLIATLGITAVLTGLTSLAQNTAQFYSIQAAVRIFSNAEDMLAAVVIVEAMRPQLRGWAIGVMAALGAAGNGVAAFVYGTVEFLPYDWRGLYVAGMVPMIVIVWLRRNLKETDYFLSYQKSRAAEAEKASVMSEFIRPLRGLVRDYPERVRGMAFALVPFSMGVAPSLAFMPKLLQEVHGYTPMQVSLLFMTAGAVALMGNFIAGRIADRIGRKKVLVTAGTLAMLAGLIGYGGASGAFLVVIWIVSIFSFFAAAVSFAALTGEIFPTSFRSTASAFRGIVGAIGAGIGFGLHSVLYAITGEHQLTIQILLICFVPIGMICLMTLLPETAGKSLDEIAPERSSP